MVRRWTSVICKERIFAVRSLAKVLKELMVARSSWMSSLKSVSYSALFVPLTIFSTIPCSLSGWNGRRQSRSMCSAERRPSLHQVVGPPSPDINCLKILILGIQTGKLVQSRSGTSRQRFKRLYRWLLCLLNRLLLGLLWSVRRSKLSHGQCKSKCSNLNSFFNDPHRGSGRLRCSGGKLTLCPCA